MLKGQLRPRWSAVREARCAGGRTSGARAWIYGDRLYLHETVIGQRGTGFVSPCGMVDVDLLSDMACRCLLV